MKRRSPIARVESPRQLQLAQKLLKVLFLPKFQNEKYLISLHLDENDIFSLTDAFFNLYGRHDVNKSDPVQHPESRSGAK